MAQTELLEAGAHLAKNATVHLRVAYHAAAAHLLTSSLELRLDENNHIRVLAKQAHDCGCHLAQRYEAQVQRGDVNELGKGIQVAQVCALHHRHGAVRPNFITDLSVSNVHAVHVPRTVLQQAVGKATRRQAAVECSRTTHVQPKDVECLLEFEASTTHVLRKFSALERDDGVRLHLHTRLACPLSVHEHLALHNEGLHNRFG